MQIQNLNNGCFKFRKNTVNYTGLRNMLKKYFDFFNANDSIKLIGFFITTNTC